MAAAKPHVELVKADEVEVGSDERELCPESHSSIEQRNDKLKSEERGEGAEPDPSYKECKRYASDNFYDRITTMIPEVELQKIVRHQKDA